MLVSKLSHASSYRWVIFILATICLRFQGVFTLETDHNRFLTSVRKSFVSISGMDGARWHADNGPNCHTTNYIWLTFVYLLPVHFHFILDLYFCDTCMLVHIWISCLNKFLSCIFRDGSNIEINLLSSVRKIFCFFSVDLT